MSKLSVTGGVWMEQAITNVLELKNIKKGFSGVSVLEDVHMSVRAGSVHALVGENGAGKSTLMKIISGIHAPDAGTIVYKGREIFDLTPAKCLELGISMIHQELSPEPYMTIAENIFLGREPRGKGLARRLVDFKKMYQDTQQILDQMGILYSPKTVMNDLSLAGKQLIEIAKAVSRNASVIIMDEPTSALTDTEVSILFKQIEELKKKGVAVIYITHKMNEIFTLADDITILRDGVMIQSGPKGLFTMESLINQMVGREIKDIFPKFEAPIGEPVLEVRGLNSGKTFSDISFTLRKGEILGLAGLVGAGRTEVAPSDFWLGPRGSRGCVCEWEKGERNEHPRGHCRRHCLYAGGPQRDWPRVMPSDSGKHFACSAEKNAHWRPAQSGTGAKIGFEYGFPAEH